MGDVCLDIIEVIQYFYEISKIPRMSGKEEKIADYIETFAKKRQLRYIRDKYNNIIIIKEANKCHKTNESIILQCHLDMVCEKEEDSNHDFNKEGVNIYIDGDFIKAKDTTLGADNGIGIAILLTILNSDKINHPRIEAIFTVQEETTMEGAKKIDVSMLKGNKMICLDNMNEEELWIGCASAKIFKYEIKGKQKECSNDDVLIEIGMNGFRGGHSGKDIAKHRGNPIEEMGNLLEILHKKYEMCLKNIYGGREVNVIPRECYSQVYIKSKDFEAINQEIIDFNEKLKKKILRDKENINIFIKKIQKTSKECFDLKTTQKIIDIIKAIPNGVYDRDLYGNPLVSLNIGKIEKRDKLIMLFFSIRSNRCEIEKKLEKELETIKIENSIQEQKNELFGYEHKQESEFVNKCKVIYRKCFKKSPKLIDMHICLEAGFFGGKIPELDFIAIAPNIYDAHSPKERCSISSLKRIYNFISLIIESI